MALNPNIPLQLAQVENPLMGLSRGIEAGSRMAARREALDLRRQQAEREETAAVREAQLEDLKRLAPLIPEIRNFSADPGERMRFAQSAIQNLGLQSLPADLINEPLDFSDENLNAYEAGLQRLTAGDRRFQAGSSFTAQGPGGQQFVGVTRFDPTGGTVEPVMQALPEGFQITGGQFKLTPEQERQRQLELQQGQQDIRLTTEPQIAMAVRQSQIAADIAADQFKQGRSNEKALAIWDASVRNLAGALGGTVTGPIAGLMPAFTANQQVADAAIRAMLPALKAIFRESGEGTFTEGDQIALERMLPGRGTDPTAVGPILENINDIVQIKLSGSPLTVEQIMQGIRGEPITPSAPTQQPEQNVPPGIDPDLWLNGFTEQERQEYLRAGQQGQ